MLLWSWLRRGTITTPILIFLLRSMLSFSTVRSMSVQPSKKQQRQLVLYWFRNNDLRVHDHPALMHAIQSAGSGKQTNSNCHLLPLYCFDTINLFGDNCRTPYNLLKCGPKRAKFILESVTDLQTELRNLGSGLAVMYGATPADSIAKMLSELQQQPYDRITIVCQEEVVKEEIDEVKSVKRACSKLPIAVKTVWGSTMYDLTDLPFEHPGLTNMPDVFTPFRTQVEKKCKIHPPLPAPTKSKMPPLPPITSSNGSSSATTILQQSLSRPIPTLTDLGYTDEQVQYAHSNDARGVMSFAGGETAGLARVKEYIWEKDLLKVYFDTRNGMLGADYSSKFSPWLAHGNVSPRYIAQQCRLYEEERVANKSTYWLVFELLWRDFCKFFAVKHGDAIFFLEGTAGQKRDSTIGKKWSTFEKNFEAWTRGKTGYPLVDANMRELAATGFLSNRGRQNVCSFLAIDLNHDWRYGADWFESHLIDYDVYSNWVNWCAGAGMTGGRLNRFNIVKQSKDYDQHGDYVRHWLPELAQVPNEFVHEPWKMTLFDQTRYNCRLGVDYPNPIVPPSRGVDGKGNGGNRDGQQRGEKQRRPNNSKSNRHQKYEMKSLKQGGYKLG